MVASTNCTESVSTVPTKRPSRLRSFFLMEDALAEAKRSRFSQDSPGWQSFATARSLAESAALLVGPTPILKYSDGRTSAFLLFCEALRWSLLAHLERLGSEGRMRSLPELWKDLTEASASRTFDGIDKDRLELAQEASTESFQPDSISEQQLVDRLGALRTVVSALLLSLENEAASVSHLRVMRVARIVGIPALLAVLCAGAGFGIWLRLQPPNLALRKPASTSSHGGGSYPKAAGAVDGYTSALGFHTLEEQSPWLLIDLQATYPVKRVKVYNRTEGWADRAVPLVIEGSEDGKQFRELARRDKDFSVWDAKFAPVNSRYVRVVAPRLTYLHLNEVEVY